MATFLTPALSDFAKDAPIRPRVLAYFRGRLRNVLHELILMEFVRQEKAGTLTKAKLARRTGKGAEQVTRWLGAPGNWTLDTVSDLLLGMGAELQLSIEHLAGSVATGPAQSSATRLMPLRNDEDEEPYKITASYQDLDSAQTP